MSDNIINPTPAEANASPVASTSAAASSCLLCGWQPIPVGYLSKNPNRLGWQHERMTADDVPRIFDGRPMNIGVLMGKPSKNLVDADLDCPEAILLAPYFLPATGAMFGHASNPDSHRLYIAEPLADTKKYELPGVGTLVELRSTGTQTIFPPSAHEGSGEAIAWAGNSPIEHVEPAHVDGNALQANVGRLAAACALAKLWPAPGSRHHASMALAGALSRAGWSEEEAATFIRVVAEAAGDEEAKARVADVRTTFKRLDKHAPATGWPALAELMGDAVVAKTCDWLGIAFDDGATLVVGRKQAKRDEGAKSGSLPTRQHQALSDPGNIIAGRIMASAVTPSRLKWLWENRIALGKYGELLGDGGLGKGTICADLVARVTRGWSMPDGMPTGLGGPRGVVWVQAEDAADDTVVPRLIAAGADLSRVILRTDVLTASGRRPLDVMADLEIIRADIKAVDAALMLVDPIVYYMPDNADAHVDKSTRKSLTPLTRLAQDTAVAIIGIRHINKVMGGSASDRGSGSKAFTNLARFSLAVGKDPQDETGLRRVLAIVKHNVGAEASSYAYQIVDASTEEFDACKVKWLGTSEITADELLGTPADRMSGHELSKVDEAIHFLMVSLKDGPQPCIELTREAKSLGISERTLDRAKKELQVTSTKREFGGNGQWVWSLPDADPEPDPDPDPTPDPAPSNTSSSKGANDADSIAPTHLAPLVEGDGNHDKEGHGRSDAPVTNISKGANHNYALSLNEDGILSVQLAQIEPDTQLSAPQSLDKNTNIYDVPQTTEMMEAQGGIDPSPASYPAERGQLNHNESAPAKGAIGKTAKGARLHREPPLAEIGTLSGITGAKVAAIREELPRQADYYRCGKRGLCADCVPGEACEDALPCYGNWSSPK